MALYSWVLGLPAAGAAEPCTTVDLPRGVAARPEGFILNAHNDASAHGEALMDVTCHEF